jgi:hypothetical protein
VGISSDEEDSPLVASELCFDDQAHLPPVAMNLQKGMAGAIDKDEDNYVILDYDSHSTAAVKDEKEGSVEDGGSDEELQIGAEKGEVLASFHFIRGIANLIL